MSVAGRVLMVVSVVLALLAAAVSRMLRVSEERAAPRRRKDDKGKPKDVLVARMLDGTGSYISASELVGIWAAVSVVPALLLASSGVKVAYAALVGLVGFMSVPVWSHAAKSRGSRHLESELAYALPLVASGLRAGLSIRQALLPVASDMGEPIRTEFRRLAADMTKGIDLDEAILAMARRNKSQDLVTLATAVGIQKTTGGNLADVIENVASDLRDKEEERADLKSKTASARTSAKALVAIPILAFVMSLVVNEATRDFYMTHEGVLPLMAGFGVIALGWIVVSKMADLKIG